ncbi:MAG: hypothetical protein GY803_15890 [Chloroflexi bacterium]|nr:hypothetical protein [Chloroflexota bacterium]
MSFLRGLPATYIVLLTAVLIVMAWDWRLSLLALTGQYLVASLLFVDVLDPRLAVVKLLIGLFVCLILYMTARQVNYGRLPTDVSANEVAEFGLGNRSRVGPYRLPAVPLRVLAAIIVLLVVWIVAQRPGFGLPALPVEAAHLNLAVYGLAGLGLLGLSLTADPLPAGLGLFILMTGFELYYSALEQSAALLAALAAANLALALAVAYLTQARYAAALADA